MSFQLPDNVLKYATLSSTACISADSSQLALNDSTVERTLFQSLDTPPTYVILSSTACISADSSQLALNDLTVERTLFQISSLFVMLS